MSPLQAHCHHGLGELYAKIGRRAEARAELSAAIGLYRTMAMTFWLPQAEAALTQAEARRPRQRIIRPCCVTQGSTGWSVFTGFSHVDTAKCGCPLSGVECRIRGLWPR